MLTPSLLNVNTVDMTQEKPKYHHGDLRSQTALLAWTKVCESGADQLSLRGCARAAGVDPAAVYRHFKSKDDLLGHLANRAFTELAEAMRSAQAEHVDSDPREALVQIGLAYISYAIANPHVFQMMFDVAGRSLRSGAAGPSPEGQGAYAVLIDGIQRLDPKGNIDVQSFTLWSLVHGFAKLVNDGLGPDPTTRDHVSYAMCQTAIAGIR